MSVVRTGLCRSEHNYSKFTENSRRQKKDPELKKTRRFADVLGWSGDELGGDHLSALQAKQS